MGRYALAFFRHVWWVVLLAVGCSQAPTAADTSPVNLPPQPAFAATTLQGDVPLRVDFDASTSTDPDGSVVGYAWDFGDGATGQGVRVQHTFGAAGGFAVVLNVTDDAGEEAAVTQTVTVDVPESALAPLTVRADGRGFLAGTEPFLWLGDTAWLLFTVATDDEVTFYLDDVKAKGFTVVQTFLTAAWDSGTRADGENVNGDKPFVDNDPTRLNPAYFDRVAWIVAEVARRGLYLSVAFGEPARTSQKGLSYKLESPQAAYTYAHALGVRLREPTLERTLVWFNGQDRNPDRDGGLEFWAALAEGLADGVNAVDRFDGRADYSTTLLSYHPDGGYRADGYSSSTWFQDAPWLDFNAVNTYKNYSSLVELVAEDVAKTPRKPTVCVEPSYENHDYDKEVRSDWHVRFQAYWCLLSGAAGYAYGHDDGFKLATSSFWPGFLESPGRLDMAHLRSVFGSRPFAKLVPDQALVVSAQGTPGEAKNYVAAARADDGGYALVYATDGREFSLDLTGFAASEVTARWFDPREGTYREAGTYPQTKAQTFDPPGEAGAGNDWLLVLDAP